ncbi:MAG TPA: hypothetical protein VGL99_04185 [Chloroflexota bacterium]|jgi:hypothetical protein
MSSVDESYDSVVHNRHAGIVLRLLVDEDGGLVSGEALDLRGVSVGRFVSWPQLGALTAAWLQAVGDNGSPGPRRMPD